jgi:hypothetical protein
MKTSVLVAALFASAAMAPIQVHAQAIQAGSKTILFDMTVSGGAAKCLPNAAGKVVDHSNGPVEVLNVQVKGLPPNTDFDFFNIQVPNAPFGLAWYLGDIQTDALGVGVGTFIGRFSIETFIVSLGAVPSPQVFPSPPAVLPNSKTGAAVTPVQIYHLGLWFNSPADATKAGCPGTATTFNGEHDAGIQVLNTGTFPDAQGPLFNLQ